MFSITPIRHAFLRQVRQTGLDDLGQTVERHVAQGGEPCRDVLRRAQAGEALMLASYCPFELASPYREYGPVFVLAADSLESPDYQSLPTVGENPYFGASFVLRAYSSRERIVDAKLSSPAHAKNDIEAFFACADVAFILARFPTYGCYACRIERPLAICIA